MYYQAVPMQRNLHPVSLNTKEGSCISKDRDYFLSYYLPAITASLMSLKALLDDCFFSLKEQWHLICLPGYTIRVTLYQRLR